jgi:hypothetical protein
MTTATSLAPLLERFFLQRLMQERRAYHLSVLR